jgi:hypothetical protein
MLESVHVTSNREKTREQCLDRYASSELPAADSCGRRIGAVYSAQLYTNTCSITSPWGEQAFARCLKPRGPLRRINRRTRCVHQAPTQGCSVITVLYRRDVRRHRLSGVTAAASDTAGARGGLSPPQLTGKKKRVTSRAVVARRLAVWTACPDLLVGSARPWGEPTYSAVMARGEQPNEKCR